MALDKVAFERDGFVVARGLVSEPHISRCLAEYRSDAVSKNVLWNPVEVVVPANGEVADLATHGGIGSAVHELIGEHLVYNVRLVVKGPGRENEVFVHQDCCYHVGGIDKLSAFVALTEVDATNGGMRFYPGTHKFGYLGDAGELNPEVLGGNNRWHSPVLHPGDVLFMHSALWHASFPFMNGKPERVMADIIYMKADDPAAFISKEMRAGMFKRSRASRLKELQEQNDALMRAASL